jgi:hypothetical protein
MQAIEQWPIFYMSVRRVLIGEEKADKSSQDPIEAYFGFRQRFIALVQALDISAWELEHLCVWYGQQNSNASNMGDTNHITYDKSPLQTGSSQMLLSPEAGQFQSEFGRPEQEDSLLPHHLEAFLVRAVETAKKTRRFEQEWRELQQFIRHITTVWEKGQALFQEDLVRATANQEEMEYLPHIDFAVDCYAYVSTHNVYPDERLSQAWAINGYMLAWRQHFLAEENTS